MKWALCLRWVYQVYGRLVSQDIFLWNLKCRDGVRHVCLFSELRHVCELSDAIIRHVCDLILSEEIGSVYPPLARSGEWPRGGGAAGQPLFLTDW